MKQAKSWLRLVADAHAAGANTWTQDQAAVYRVTGGNNNALYRIEADGAYHACKLCVDDFRRRAAHEYGALQLLQAVGLDIAPKPVYLDESCTIVPFPAVIYSWLPGKSLDPPLTADQLALFLNSFQQVHAVRPGDVDSDPGDSWWHWFDFAPYLIEMESFLNEYGPWLATTGPDGSALRDRLARLVEVCDKTILTCDVDPAREQVTVGLCRVDANLANTVLGPDRRLRWVDWEYSGWGDLALDLADMRWHATLTGLSQEQHHWIRDQYRRPDDDPAFDARLAVWDRIVATRWGFLVLRWLWSLYHGPDRVRLTQLTADPAQVRARLVRFIERAEGLNRYLSYS